MEKLIQFFFAILRAVKNTLIGDWSVQETKQSSQETKKETATPVELGISSSDKPEYRRSKSLLTYRERILYRVLKKSVNDEYLIMAKVRMADFIWLANEPEDRKLHINKILCKHVDFLLCNKFRQMPVLVIELDDPSHQWPGRAERDKFKDDVFTSVGIPILRVIMQDNYSVSELKEQIKEYISKNSVDIMENWQ